MAVSTDTIQTLLRQRQDLREALLNLRKEIETLDASSLDLVNKNIKTSSPPTVAAQPEPSSAAKPAAAEIPPKETAEPPSEPEQQPGTAAPALEKKPVASEESTRKEPVLTAPTATPQKQTVAAPVPVKAGTTAKATPETAAADEDPRSAPKEEAKKAPDEKSNGPDDPPMEEEDHDDLTELLEKARALSDYLLDHPSKLPAAELGALDAAITVSEAAKTPAEKKACYHTLQAAYRKISAATFAASGVSGTTLQDSAAGAPLLWTIPFAISLLILIVFPLLLLARHLVGEMFTDDFANDLIWSFGLAAAFLWGVVGALTLLALNIARLVYRRRFDGGGRRSPALRGALGGLIGAVAFMIVEIWLPMSDATADFAHDAIAFAGGLLSAILFVALQRMINAITGWIEPATPVKIVKK